jgi:hypothetical protein
MLWTLLQVKQQTRIHQFLSQNCNAPKSFDHCCAIFRSISNDINHCAVYLVLKLKFGSKKLWFGILRQLSALVVLQRKNARNGTLRIIGAFLGVRV